MKKSFTVKKSGSRSMDISSLSAAAFIFLIGISSGVFLELHMNDSDKFDASVFIKDYLDISSSGAEKYPNPFMNDLTANALLVFFIMLSGFISFGFIFAHCVSLYKGMTLGYSCSLLLEALGASSIPVIMINMLPQSLFIIPAFMIAVSEAQRNSLHLAGGSNDLNVKKGRYRFCDNSLYAKSFIFPFVLILSGCALEAVIFIFYRA